ncbi:unnamed protein product [Mytilus coruscus]|uniref:Uncharacterized protein n=1 Tax=Mytilus coruscus TaxID=42192 RepID=A0A6J8E0H4_MYTCO|nr:unnamed protein product [Mytilus coruscus]
MLKTTKNKRDVTGDNEKVTCAIFQKRRSSNHLQDAEKDLDLRANSLIGLTKQELQKLVNFDNEYFKQLSKSPTGRFSNPVFDISTGNNSTGLKQTAYFIDDHSAARERTTAMELRRAFSNLTKDSIGNRSNKTNVYQQAFKRSKTDMPEMYTNRKFNLPPLHKVSADNRMKKRMTFGAPKSSHDSISLEQLPPIQLLKRDNRINDRRTEEKENELHEKSLDRIDEKTDDIFAKQKQVLAFRHSNGQGVHAYTGELKLHPNQSELNDLIERSKNPASILNTRPLRRAKANGDMGFLVSSTNESANELNAMKEQKSNFEIRKEYGKNLEKNWFKSFLQQAKAQKKGNLTSSKFDVNLELFYSPEPTERENEQFDDVVASDIDSNCDDSMDLLEGYERDNRNKVTEMKHFERKKHLLDISALYASTDVLTGEDNELDRDTDSDIEIILKDNELVQKKTKHKMRKKRRKKENRYKEIIEPENIEIPPLTDKELRAMRLNIKKKMPAPVLTGKRKFLQVANAVFVAIQFRKLLNTIRERKKKRRGRKSKKKLRRVKWKPSIDEYGAYERTVTSPTLKDKFMADIGTDLLKDVQNLDISNTEILEGTEIEQDRKSRPLSKFGIEVSKACVEDVERLLTDQNRTLKKFSRLRRHSAPLLSMPEGLLIEIKEKSKGRKRDRSKSIRRIKSTKKKNEKRSKSPNVVRKCSCIHHEHVISDRKTSVTRASHTRSSSCVFKEESEIPKAKYFRFHRSQVLKRRPSLNEEEFKKTKGVDLHELLRGIDMAAKDVKIQIIMRKMKKQKRQKAQILNAVLRTPEESENTDEEPESCSDSETDESSSEYDEYNTMNTTPFVSSGVQWTAPKSNRRHFTAADVDRELKRVTRFFLEMKECSYIRFTGINQAIVKKLDEIMT